MSTDPEKSRKIASMCWKRGSEAMVQQNWDYAIEMYAQAVSLVPDNLVYRQSLRGCECKKYGDNKTGARFAGTKLLGIKGRITKSRSGEDWKALDAAAEEGLKVNPWDANLNAAMAEACYQQGFTDLAEWGYKRAVDAEPENKELNRQLAVVLEERGNYGEAITVWERIHKLDPLDAVARSKQMQLQASKVMEREYEGKKSTHEVKTAYDAFRGGGATLPGGVDATGVSMEADLQRAIRKDPANVQNYLKLADYYKREKQLQDALQTYQQALEASGGDQNVREQMEDIELLVLKQNLDLAKEAARENTGDETARKNAADLSLELLRREIEVISRRVERYPVDMRLKYELARRLMRGKKWQQAIPLLQRAASDSRLAAEVLVALSKCWIQENQKSLALRQAEKAIPLLNQHDQEDLFCEAHYLAGYLYEDAGNREKAEQHYTEVLGVNFGFRDVRQRLERMQGGGDASK